MLLHFPPIAQETCAQSVLREEIRRIKATDPNITHKEAFSAASKNVSSLQLTAKLQTVSASLISALFVHHYPSRFLHFLGANYHMDCFYAVGSLTKNPAEGKLKDLLLLHTVSRSASCKEGYQD